MNTQHLLPALEALGARLTLRGNRLRIDAPRGIITQDLHQRLRQHKATLVEQLRQRLASQARYLPPIPDTEAVASMPIDQFAEAGLVVQIHSEVLDCDVLLVSDNVPDRELMDADLAVYRASEMSKLALLRPDPLALRTLHEVKSVFTGTITEVEPLGGDHDKTLTV